MKKLVLVFIVTVSFLSCNNIKKTEPNSTEKEIEQQAEQKSISVLNADEISAYGERGLEYAQSAQAVLGKNLMQAINKDGTSGALSFCNEQAYPLTDSMAVVHNTRLKRVSDKPRNQANQANTEELEYIETFKKAVVNQETLSPLVKDSDTQIQVYYPILTNAMCLQCHGTPNKNVEPSTLKKLSILYPKDQALNYDANEVRGIWRVTFDK